MMKKLMSLTMLALLVCCASFAYADLVFYSDEANFLTTHSGLTWEGFDNTNVAPGGFVSCEGPFNSMTDNDCYSPGAIVDGISFDSDGLCAVLGVGILGNDSVWVGPTAHADNSFITLDPPVSVFGSQIFMASTYDIDGILIEVFGVSGLLGSETVPDFQDGRFWGVFSSGEAITEISFHVLPFGAEVFDYVYFGNSVVATEASTWGSVKSLYR